MNSLPPNHPIWHTIHVVAVGLVATLVLYLTANHFDETELKAIGGIITGTGIAQFAMRKLSGGGQ